jgi:chaperonin GroEL
MKLENVEITDLGKADSVVSTKGKTTIIGWGWSKDEIKTRVEELKKKIEESDSKFDIEKLQERLAKLDWWVAVIKVGAASEVEAKEKKLRIEDALNATRAAVSEWVVAWGWTALLKASKVLDDIDLWHEDKNLWASIVKQALRYPITQIVTNAWKEWSVVVNEIIKNENINYWYDASSDNYVDMLEAWIIDPKKVERVALQEAVSLAWMFLTTESAITDIPKKEDSSCSDWSCHSPAWMWMY